jgi:hypothetical protein
MLAAAAEEIMAAARQGTRSEIGMEGNKVNFLLVNSCFFVLMRSTRNEDVPSR